MSNDKLLYERLDSELGKRSINKCPIDEEILSNLNPKFELREYQKSAFQYFKAYFENKLEFKQPPLSVLLI
jgi:superfamily II DNA or RNA helicase